MKESTLSLSVKQVRMLRPDVAVVHFTGTNKTPRGAETHTADFQNTAVAAGR